MPRIRRIRTDSTDTHGFGISDPDHSFLSFVNITLLNSGVLPKFNNSPTSLSVAFKTLVGMCRAVQSISGWSGTIVF